MPWIATGRRCAWQAGSLRPATVSAQETADEPRQTQHCRATGDRRSRRRREELTLSGSFTIEQGSRGGMLTIGATIEPGWHIYSITQPDGATQRTRLKPANRPISSCSARSMPDRAPQIKQHEYSRSTSKSTTASHLDRADRVCRRREAGVADDQGQRLAARSARDSCEDFTAEVAAKFAGFTEPPHARRISARPRQRAGGRLKGHIEPGRGRAGRQGQAGDHGHAESGLARVCLCAEDPDEVGANKPTLIHLNRCRRLDAFAGGRVGAKPQGRATTRTSR